ncbi:MAG: TolB family protein [bacterium]
MVFSRIIQGSVAGPTLWTKDISGGEARPLIGSANRSGPEFNPSVSPDGRWLAFDDGFKIFLVQLADGLTVDLSPFIGSGLSEPDWAPDSHSIVGNGRNTLRVFSTDAGMAIEQTMIPGGFSNPSWSFPHPVFGSSIAATGYGGIFVMAEDGSDQELVISGGKDPSWSPDGTMLAFVKKNQLFILPVFSVLKN